MQNFRALGAPPPAPIDIQRLETSLPPQTQKLAPPLRISGYAPGSNFGEDLFLSLPEFGEKSVPFLVKTFFCSSLNLLT